MNEILALEGSFEGAFGYFKAFFRDRLFIVSINSFARCAPDIAVNELIGDQVIFPDDICQELGRLYMEKLFLDACMKFAS